jgi:hypothetical protein
MTMAHGHVVHTNEAPPVGNERNDPPEALSARSTNPPRRRPLVGPACCTPTLVCRTPSGLETVSRTHPRLSATSSTSRTSPLGTSQYSFSEKSRYKRMWSLISLGPTYPASRVGTARGPAPSSTRTTMGFGLSESPISSAILVPLALDCGGAGRKTVEWKYAAQRGPESKVIWATGNDPTPAV